MEDVQARIRKLLGAARVSGARLQADATLTRSAADRWLLRLIVREGELVGERTIEGRACEDLAGAAAVNLVLQLHSASQPSAAERPRARTTRARAARAPAELGEPKPESQRPAEPAAGPSVAQAPEEVPATQPPAAPSEAAEPAAPAPASPLPAERGWRGLLQLQLTAAVLGPLPRPSFGLALAGGVQLERWRVLAAANLWLPQSLPAPDPKTVGAQVDRAEAGLLVCRTLMQDRLELAPCARVSLEHMWARGSGARVASRAAESTWFAAGLSLQARFALNTWLGLVAGIDAELELARPSITIAGFGRLGQLDRAALRFNFGAEWIL